VFNFKATFATNVATGTSLLPHLLVINNVKDFQLIFFINFSHLNYLSAHAANGDEGLISPTFYAQLLNLQVYANLTGARCRAYSIEVERIF
jgi:hypothetical protein